MRSEALARANRPVRRSRNKLTIIDTLGSEQRIIESPAPVIEPLVALVKWEDMLKDSPKVGLISKCLIGHLMPFILSATEAWKIKIAEMEKPEAKALSKPAQLKRFFALNPFGCRNKRMIDLLCILLECKREDITPRNLSKRENEESEDGSDDDEGEDGALCAGILEPARPGCAIKVIGATENLRHAKLSYAYKDIIFIRRQNRMSIVTGVREDEGVGRDITLSNLFQFIAPMPEHYIPAPPEEILEVLLTASYGALSGLAKEILPNKELQRLLSDQNNQFIEEDDDEGPNDEEEEGETDESL
jgi:hypothetical protein